VTYWEDGPEGPRDRIASGYSPSALGVWDAGTGALVHTLEHTDWVSCVAVYRSSSSSSSASSGGAGACRLVTGCTDGSLRVWDAERGALLHTLVKHEGRVVQLLVLTSPDGRLRLISAGERKGLRVWDLGETPMTIDVRAANKLG
jgi:WD40 repeat protein